MTLKLPKNLSPSLDARLLLAMVLSVVVTSMSAAVAVLVFQGGWLAFVLSLLAGLCAAFILTVAVSRHLKLGLKAVDQGLLNLKDNDFSMTLAPSSLIELDGIFQNYNTLVDSLRKERQSIFQRELLLDTVIENSSMCVLISDQSKRIIYSNRLAEHLLNHGKAITGLPLRQLLEESPLLLSAIEAEQSGIFRLNDQSEALHHLSCGHFVLNAKDHTLILIKEMTREINRQEAATWKKVIRIISHELNNSLAPISSLAHSGKLLLAQNQYAELPDVFDTLAERSEHLKNFVGKYADIAKLPRPNKAAVDWHKFYQGLTRGYPFNLLEELPSEPGYFDAGQLHQVLLNLLKNASESGSSPEQINLRIHQSSKASIIEISDRGTGMSSDVLQNALLPFYSTKTGGSGVGLPLCREIVEAHNGQMALSNRKHGGLRVSITLPLNA
ncbi:PAS domain-containing sensor histidine kinase [Marinimicrobium sp. ABcell2]|uniref:sensor histidine kinase n=1 Tax=Marinimicrobium sp. ABcell2 TaxID=3069751 RepID=UPI0027B0F1AC|nr:ATP-binding protein [Marinimicrobium sp. ABcell2]MDQ2077749.1 ATP-binding protein [Marinimicrobium sp. ABcell2]